MSNVVPLAAAGIEDIEKPKPPLRDVAAVLRAIADQVEAGEYGEVLRGALVLRAIDREPQIFGMGDMPIAEIAYMDFHAGADQLMSMKGPTR